MIVFDLSCDNAHVFEGWFGSTDDYKAQRERGLVTCPTCGSYNVDKAPMAPAVPAKGNASGDVAVEKKDEQLANTPMPPEVAKAFMELAKAQAKALEKSEWVGDKFAEEARSMHYGEKDEALIHGQATRDEAVELAEEGIAVAPLIVPVAPPEELN